MKNTVIIFMFLLIGYSVIMCPLSAQTEKPITEMSREDVLNIPYDQLIEMPLDQLMQLAEIVGVSLDELYEMILNKDVVSASKKVESSFEAPLSTSVISSEEIISSGAKTIEEALRLVPGLIVREKTNGNYDIHIRGNENVPGNHMLLYSENSISLIMIDGRPVYNYAHGGTFWETLPVSFGDIDRIEVVRGPSSALYGPNAVSGVINIITREVQDPALHISGLAQMGTQNTFSSSLGIAKGFNDKVKFRVTGNFENMDRDRPELYVYKANDGDGGYISKDELAILRDPDQPEYFVFDPADDVDEMYPDPMNSRRKSGVNGYLFYDLSENYKVDVSAGYQNSEILSSTMGDNPSSYAGRVSSTFYSNVIAKMDKLSIQANYTGGWQDIVRQDTGFKIDLSILNATAEYDLAMGKLNLRPGVSYQQAIYDDRSYLGPEGQGFLNNEESFNSLAITLRADYTYEDLRLIAALRGEKYSTHDDPRLSYQFVGAYSISNQHMIRGVYSRANRGPFLIDSYANYLWDREGRPSPGQIYFQGTQNLDLLTMDMIELGYRIKPANNFQADFEVFYTKTQNYGALYPDSISLLANGTPTDRPYVRMSYMNIATETEQMGITAEISYILNKNIVFKTFGTIQKSLITNNIIETPEGLITKMIVAAKAGKKTFFDQTPFNYIDEENKSTPSFYGGLIANAKFLNQKLNVNVNSYYFSEQVYQTKYEKEDKVFVVDPKLVLNAKISYQVIEQGNVFINGRNLISDSREFPYMDKIGPIFMAGININF